MLQKIILFTLALGVLYNAQAQSKTKTGRDYAVFFYVTDFQQGWQPLPETKPEAEKIEKELTTNFGFTCELVSNPTRQAIREKIRAYNALLTPNDQVLFFFSTHGHYVSTRDRGYLIGKDGLLNDKYGDTWFAYDDLRSDLDGCNAQHILLILDACHSGSFGIRNKSVPDEPIYNQKEDCQTKVANTMQHVGRQYCTSGNKNAKTPAKSLFAARLLESLRKGGENGVLRFDDLEYWIGKVENPKPESGSFSLHEPGGDFIFVRKNACGTTSPDSDGDGVPDTQDKCPTVWGSNPDGCSPVFTEDNTAADLAAWKKAKQLDTQDAYLAYLKQFKEPEFKEQANTALRRLEAVRLALLDDIAYELAEERNDIDAFKKYKANWPQGRHIAEAIQKIKDLEMPDDGLVLVPGGTFTMGCTSEQKDCESNEQAHQVTLSDFYIGKYEVTQKLWTEIMGENPSNFKSGDNYPVERVSWDDVQTFLSKLNTKYPNRNYRLPTEAEWEYAARGGGKAVLFGNGKNTLDPKEANFNGKEDYKKSYSVTGEYRNKTTPVGSFIPNALGLYDMSGNVWEWCSDWYGSDYYKNSPATNPQGPTSGSYRVFRGGSWCSVPLGCRVAIRYNGTPGDRSNVFGFRLARTK
jgi:formylglycine-generating enzyme required for sulfatase activity